MLGNIKVNCSISIVALCLGTVGNIAYSQTHDSSITTPAVSAVTPEVPAIILDLPVRNNFLDTEDSEESKGGLAYPHMQPYRVTSDGRIGTSVKGIHGFKFYHIVPEKLDTHLLLSERGFKGIEERAIEIPTAELFSGTGINRIGAKTICEKTPTNPTADGNGNDVYNITVVGLGERNRNSPLSFVSHDFRVVIANPKTANARILSVESVEGSDVIAPLPSSIWGQRPNSYFEPNVTADGMLYLVRFTRGNGLAWDLEGDPGQGSERVIYTYNAENNQPCDVEAWAKRPFPVTHAFFDEAINQKYGFAQYQMRDPEGNFFLDGERSRGAYPYLGLRGEMLFMEYGDDTLHYTDESGNLKSRYPTSCGDPTSTNLCRLDQQANPVQYIRRYEITQADRAVVAVGLWTHGKMVELDNLINHHDYGMNDENYQHLNVGLYEPNTGEGDSPVNTEGKVLLAANKIKRRQSTNAPDHLNYDIITGAQLGSMEHRFNYLPNMRPITPRDIVWQMSKGNGVTTEMAFDDFIDPNVMIYAPMNTTFVKQGVDDIVHQNGFGFSENGGGKGFTETVHFQNAATADRDARASDPNLRPQFFNIPEYGVGIGSMRIEPVAMGGVKGKGAWLDGTNEGISFNVERQNRSVQNDIWYYGVFFDPRSNRESRLLTLPNKAYVTVDVGRGLIKLKKRNGNVVQALSLSQEVLKQKNWTHLGLKVYPSRIDIFINGNLVQRVTRLAARDFRLKDRDLPGNLLLGASRNKVPAFKGWVDELKMIRLQSNTSMEMTCEHARGTLVGLDDSYNGELNVLAMGEGSLGLAAIDRELNSNGLSQQSSNRYACYVDYTNHIGANLAQIPEASHSLRDALLVPAHEKLVFDDIRPDATNNTFCTSCHVEGHPITLDVNNALGARSALLQDDPRRQPIQQLPRMFGVIPANMFENGPNQNLDAGVDGIETDEYVNH
ncbi:hypothetical protein [Enterovibrio calviensis]|uniref:hypothetical protein n=1 Tax=Enterovibrio calviensis TaxID=91359 RepID=UPI0004840A0A|nr:hypothetical protein [Enterovibrio calviensis]